MKKIILLALLPILMTACEQKNANMGIRYIPCQSEEMPSNTKSYIGAAGESIEYKYSKGMLKLTHNLIVHCNVGECKVDCSVEVGSKIEITERPTPNGPVDPDCMCMSQVIVEMPVPKAKYDVYINLYSFDPETKEEHFCMTQRYVIDLNISTAGTVYIENYKPVLKESDVVDEQLVGEWECIERYIPASPYNPYLPGDEGFFNQTLIFDKDWNVTKNTDKETIKGRYAIGSYSYEDPESHSMTDGGNYIQFKYGASSSIAVCLYKVDADTLWTYPEPLTVGGSTFKFKRK